MKVGDGTPGPGRPKGSPNKSTVTIKQAIVAVYADLQKKAVGPTGDHAHFLEWAEEHPTEFYKLAAKLIPIQVDSNVSVMDRTELLQRARDEVRAVFGERPSLSAGDGGGSLPH